MSYGEVSNHLTGGRSFYETSAKYSDTATEKTERWNARESRHSLTMTGSVQRKNPKGGPGIEARYIYLYRGIWDTAEGHAEIAGTNGTTFAQAYRQGTKVGGFHVEGRKEIGSKP